MRDILFVKSKEKANFLQKSFLEEKPPLEERVIFYTGEDYKNFGTYIPYWTKHPKP